MKRILVTGASGFIGRFVLPLLVEDEFEVHALLWRGETSQIAEVHWHEVDLMDNHAVVSLLTDLQATHLLHLAWYTEHGKFWNSDKNLQWVACSLNLLNRFVSLGGKRVVMAGTCAEYDWNEEHCSEMNTPCNPATLYGISKYALFKIAESYCLQNNVKFSWGRIFFPYGPGDGANRFVPTVINGLLRQESIACSEGKQVRDFIYVEDVASAFVALLKSELSGAVNIASGESYSLRQIGEIIKRLIDGEGQIRFGAIPGQDSEPALLTADVRRLRDGSNWRPAFHLEAGLTKTIDWWKHNQENSVAD